MKVKSLSLFFLSILTIGLFSCDSGTDLLNMRGGKAATKSAGNLNFTGSSSDSSSSESSQTSSSDATCQDFSYESSDLSGETCSSSSSVTSSSVTSSSVTSSSENSDSSDPTSASGFGLMGKTIGQDSCIKKCYNLLVKDVGWPMNTSFPEAMCNAGQCAAMCTYALVDLSKVCGPVRNYCGSNAKIKMLKRICRIVGG